MAIVKAISLEEKAKEMSSILAMANEFVSLDIETTTLSPAKGGRIIEVAGVKVKNGEIVDTYSQLINPEQKIYRKTIELTGITNEMLEGKPVYGQVLPEFYRFIGSSVVVAHNAGFDWDRFLLPFFKRVGIHANNLVIDTMNLSKLYYPELKSYRLNELCEKFEIPLENHHRALADAVATAKLAIYYQKNHAGEYQTQLNLEDNSIEEKPVQRDFRILRVRYWEKQVTRKNKMQRVYVNMNIGTVFFDIPSRTWYNKDVEQAIDFKEIQEAVLKHLNLNSVVDLCFYRK